jgi:hypothetical protein
LGSDSPQVAHGQSDISTCGEHEPTPKPGSPKNASFFGVASSNFAREANFATASHFGGLPMSYGDYPDLKNIKKILIV